MLSWHVGKMVKKTQAFLWRKKTFLWMLQSTNPCTICQQSQSFHDTCNGMGLRHAWVGKSSALAFLGIGLNYLAVQPQHWVSLSRLGSTLTLPRVLFPRPGAQRRVAFHASFSVAHPTVRQIFWTVKTYVNKCWLVGGWDLDVGGWDLAVPWMRSSRTWMRSSRTWMRSSRMWMRSSREVDNIYPSG